MMSHNVRQNDDEEKFNQVGLDFLKGE